MLKLELKLERDQTLEPEPERDQTLKLELKL